MKIIALRRPVLLVSIACFMNVDGALARQHPWPVTPFDESHQITGTFCEYRDTGSSPHFHNGADIPKADGSPVYPVVDGTVTSIGRVGGSAFVRVGSIAYVHINPAASLSIGDAVKTSETVLGTILSGLGHVHFTDGFVNSEQNALRADGGLTPYDDPWPPVIQDVRFYQFGTDKRFPTSNLSGPVTITFRVREANAPPGASESRLNNGAYISGFQILTRDRSEIVYSPGGNGVVFQFDNKPSNSYVHNVFDPAQSSTSTHVYFITNELRKPSFLDTESLPEGEYTLDLFAADTRGNRDDEYLDITISRRDLIPPDQPVLRTVTLQNSNPLLRFESARESDLAGFRILSSTNNFVWTLLADETTVPADASTFQPSENPAAARYYFLVAVDSVSPPNVSLQSDVYGVHIGEKEGKILIVDGFDRTQSSGSWHQPWHSFAYTWGLAVRANKFTFETCANETVLDGTIRLSDYDAVLWLLGDESSNDETFSQEEQVLVKAYLESGGRLFVSGSEVAWDLEGRGGASAADTDFLHRFLKAAFKGDDAKSLTARGIDGGVFAGMNTFGFGQQPYDEDWPDYFTPAEGGVAGLSYGNGLVAGVQYEGVFGDGVTPGKLVMIGFPFETISASGPRNLLMKHVLDFFFATPTAIAETGGLPRRFMLAQNYPNPFRTQTLRKSRPGEAGTTFRFGAPQASELIFVIYDILGRETRRWPATRVSPGFHTLHWNGRNGRGKLAAPGTYFFVVKPADGEGFAPLSVKLQILR